MQKKTLFFNKIISFKKCGYHRLQPKDELLTFFFKYRRNVQAKNTISPTKIFLQRLKMPGFSQFGDLVDFFNGGPRTTPAWRSSRLLQWWAPHHRQNRHSCHHPCWAYRPCQPCLKMMIVLNVVFAFLKQKYIIYKKNT
jgi:hypothetical protein